VKYNTIIKYNCKRIVTTVRVESMNYQIRIELTKVSIYRLGQNHKAINALGS